MTGAELLSRYEWNVGWNTEMLLDVLVELLSSREGFDNILLSLDAIAEQEAELYAGMPEEE